VLFHRGHPAPVLGVDLVPARVALCTPTAVNVLSKTVAFTSQNSPSRTGTPVSANSSERRLMRPRCVLYVGSPVQIPVNQPGAQP
jgi:hypothetical protein